MEIFQQPFDSLINLTFTSNTFEMYVSKTEKAVPGSSTTEYFNNS